MKIHREAIAKLTTSNSLFNSSFGAGIITYVREKNTKTSISFFISGKSLHLSPVTKTKMTSRQL